jgi:hypothetical protein
LTHKLDRRNSHLLLLLVVCHTIQIYSEIVHDNGGVAGTGVDEGGPTFGMWSLGYARRD